MQKSKNAPAYALLYCTPYALLYCTPYGKSNRQGA